MGVSQKDVPVQVSPAVSFLCLFFREKVYVHIFLIS